jgi:hypothetical protein
MTINQTDHALRVAMAAVEQLPRKQQRQLTERLIATTVLQENTTVLFLQRLSPQKQARLAELLDKNNDERLNRKERLELQRLALEVDQILLANSHALAQALRPELFDKRGRLIKSRFRQTLNAPSFRHANPNPQDGE